jgi:hypothetical protein
MSSAGLVAANGGVGQDEERWREASHGEPAWDCWRTGGTGLMAAAWVISSSKLRFNLGKWRRRWPPDCSVPPIRGVIVVGPTRQGGQESDIPIQMGMEVAS